MTLFLNNSFCQMNNFNANYLPLGKDFGMIASQAPSPNNINNFWTMVLRTKVKVLLMLTPLMENEKSRSEKYWPAPGQSFTFPNLVTTKSHPDLVITGMEAKFHQGFMITKLRLTFLDKNEKMRFRDLIHLYYDSWPDNKAIAIKDCENIIDVLDEALQITKSKTFLTHCFAGIGRTGTIAAILRGLLSEEDAMTAIENLRKYRKGMVQTICQFRLVKAMIEKLRG